MKIVFIGPPGAGKGTQCNLLSKHLGVPHISTGEMLRSLDAETGGEIHLRIDRGHFAPDDFILKMVAERLSKDDCRRGFLLDGFPRTLVQAKAFDEAMSEPSQKIDHVVHLIVDANELVYRLAQRSKTGARSDDSAEFIQERFRIYEERTAPLLEHYGAQGLVRAVDAMSMPEVVFDRVCDAINVGR
ncbi:adenylate kinase [Rhodopirellula rubra]|uniref:Adenylate kinase n=1 Tax=Aporhodopirellula rubra TaxID=980271 RepID=A0A7W5H7I5_9BACT|nr:adenylate kinase [Aporhodopirellula rubra]MBB3208403.1 adenylate kinase [Aporhodopirellula rubra]